MKYFVVGLQNVKIKRVNKFFVNSDESSRVSDQPFVLYHHFSVSSLLELPES